MYTFKAIYLDWDGLKRLSRIDIDSDFCDSEKEVYLLAMKKAVNCVKLGETLISLEFIQG